VLLACEWASIRYLAANGQVNEYALPLKALVQQREKRRMMAKEEEEEEEEEEGEEKEKEEEAAIALSLATIAKR
jgi:CO dehydrogenase/acetyl-CoA synthase beta subunit